MRKLPTYHYTAVRDPQTDKWKPYMPVDMVADWGPASLFLPRSAERSAELVEATTGFEPVNRGFAAPYPTHDPAQESTHDTP
jgi:hypothetical protein